MNKLRELENKFKKGVIKKEDYIQEMHSLHTILWSYLDFIKDRNIGSIEISENQILFKTKDGLKMACNAEDKRAIPVEILNFGNHEAEELKMIRKFLKKDGVILDIGANIGWYCLNLAKDVPEGRILAFEPIPKTYEYLKKNIAINGIKNVEIHNFGLSDKNKEVIFYYDPNLSGASSLKNLDKDRKKVKIKGRVKRMDSFISRLTKRIDFIKCDIEGAEIFAIKGGLKTIKKTLPVIFLEMLRKWSAKYGYHPNDIIKILKEVGYKCFFIKNGKLINIKKVNEKTTATNFFFLHKSHKNLL